VPKAKPLPPPPLNAGQQVTLSPQIRARYPLWHPPVQGTVDQIRAQLNKDGALEVWVTWAKFGNDRYVVPSNDLVPV